jgi:toxin ParE1/3/4
MPNYRLTKAAEFDIEDIAFFGIQRFGLTQAQDYHRGLKTQFEAIAANPMHYQAVDHIRAGYRRCVFGSHSIYYTVHADGILIIRILRSQDTIKHLPNV